MRHPVNALRPFLVTMAKDSREKLAAKLFDPAKLRDLMTDRAKAGFTDLAVGPEEPFDLRDTDAARAAEIYLTANGLTFRWATRRSSDVMAPNAGADLVVSWVSPAKD